MPSKNIFITGIGTGIGKTIISSILVEKFKADYWKPIQSGDLDSSDTMRVQSLISNKETTFHPETYKLTQPYSPHKSAAVDGIKIEQSSLNLPETSNKLIVEGAGGLMVPLNENYLMVDLIKKFATPVVLVSQNYLGSINHTLMSINVLKQFEIPLLGIIFNGFKDIYTKEFILDYSGAEFLGHVPDYNKIDKKTIHNAGSFILDFF